MFLLCAGVVKLFVPFHWPLLDGPFYSFGSGAVFSLNIIFTVAS